MPPALEADVGLIHIAGGALRNTPPPGTAAHTAPRRSGRGRADDLLFVNLGLLGPSTPAPDLQGHLTQLSVEAFYKTPGSVTAALRAAAAVINDRLNDINRERDGRDLHANWMAAVLRGGDFYAAQAGHGEAVHVRAGSVRRFSSEQAARRALGTSPTPALRYHHFEVRPGDLILVTAREGPNWSEPVLQAISDFEPARAIEQLSHTRERDITGLLLRLVPEGQAASTLPESAQAAALRPEPKRSGAQAPRASTFKILTSVWSWVGQRWQPIGSRLRSLLVRAAAAVTRLLVRLAPGLIEAPRPGEFSPALLASTAVAVPLIVLTVVSVVYLRRGRTQQYQAYLHEAQRAVATAQAASESSAAGEAWGLASYYLQRAGEYGDGADRRALATQVGGALDEINQVIRLEFTPAVSGGFGGGAAIESLAATASDLYVLDTANQTIFHAWTSGRGYDINNNFDCLDGPDSVQGVSTPVDLAIQAEPGALGAEGVVAVDADGTLLYCAPDRRSLTTQLAAPSTGFGRIEAVDVFQGTLYVLDPRANAVWLYDASGGVFSGEAQLYFVGEVPDLSGAIDIARSQDELFILYSDGRFDRCQRGQPDGGEISVTCEQDLSFDSPAVGGQASPAPDAVSLTEIRYSPPPEPALFLLDEASRAVFRYSMRVVYQGRIEPAEPFRDPITSLALGPPNDIFVAAAGQVYYAPLR